MNVKIEIYNYILKLSQYLKKQCNINGNNIVLLQMIEDNGGSINYDDFCNSVNSFLSIKDMYEAKCKGYIKKTRNKLYITEKGETFLHNNIKLRDKQLDLLYEILGEEDCYELLRIMQKIDTYSQEYGVYW